MLWIIVIVALFISYIVSRNGQAENLFDQLRDLDVELESRLNEYVSSIGTVDVYTIQEIREMLKKDYMSKHKIDDFKIYKESMYKIRLELRHGFAIQGLEWITNTKQPKLKEIFIDYGDSTLLGL